MTEIPPGSCITMLESVNVLICLELAFKIEQQTREKQHTYNIIDLGEYCGCLNSRYQHYVSNIEVIIRGKICVDCSLQFMRLSLKAMKLQNRIYTSS